MTMRGIFLSVLLFTASFSLSALPVGLGEVDIGLESFDGYQEGRAFLSTDESGASLEILIAYKGFGLDTVTWTFTGIETVSVRAAAADAAWWRSRLLEMDIGQTVQRDAASVNPALLYSYRGQRFPFETAEHVLRFVRQGRDYALLLTESSPGAETRRSGEKTLPVFTLHFPGKVLPVLRDIISEDNVSRVLAEYAAEKAAIETILSSGPQASAAESGR